LKEGQTRGLLPCRLIPPQPAARRPLFGLRRAIPQSDLGQGFPLLDRGRHDRAELNQEALKILGILDPLIGELACRLNAQERRIQLRMFPDRVTGFKLRVAKPTREPLPVSRLRNLGSAWSGLYLHKHLLRARGWARQFQWQPGGK
jgi:hypothetical protein